MDMASFSAVSMFIKLHFSVSTGDRGNVIGFSLPDRMRTRLHIDESNEPNADMCCDHLFGGTVPQGVMIEPIRSIDGRDSCRRRPRFSPLSPSTTISAVLLIEYTAM